MSNYNRSSNWAKMLQVNLAAADVLIALCCMWPHLVNDLTKPAFVLGAFMCKFNAFAQSKLTTIVFVFRHFTLCCQRGLNRFAERNARREQLLFAEGV